MEFKSGQTRFNCTNATITMESGDHLSIGYTTPDGKFHVFNILAQHMIFMAVNAETDKAILVRPGDISFVN